MEPDCRNHALSIYLNRSRKDKIPSTATADQWKDFHRKWFAQVLTARQLAIEVYRGHSFAHLHNGRKTKEFWQSAGYIALDFDTGDERSSLDYLAGLDFVDWFSSFAYTTPSHTPEAPRARVVWVLETPVTDFQKYTELYRAMLYNFPWADQSTKDVARFFFGSKDCTVWGNWSLLTSETAGEIVSRWKKENPPPPEPAAIITIHRDVNDRFLEVCADKLISNVLNAPNGEKHKTLRDISRTFGGYVGGGYYNQGDVEQWLRAAIDKRGGDITNQQQAYETIKQGIEHGKTAPLSFDRAYELEDVR